MRWTKKDYQEIITAYLGEVKENCCILVTNHEEKLKKEGKWENDEDVGRLWLDEHKSAEDGEMG